MVRLGRAKDAVPYLDRAVIADPNYSYTYAMRAEARAAAGNGRGALLDAAAALMGDRKSPWSHYAEARAYQALGNRSAALAAVELAQSLHPQDKLIRSARDEILAMTLGSKI